MYLLLTLLILFYTFFAKYKKIQKKLVKYLHFWRNCKHYNKTVIIKLRQSHNQMTYDKFCLKNHKINNSFNQKKLIETHSFKIKILI